MRQTEIDSDFIVEEGGYPSLTQKDSATQMHGLAAVRNFLLHMTLPLKTLIILNIFDWLSVSFLVPIQPRSFSLCSF